jgi:hypothetical protein
MFDQLFANSLTEMGMAELGIMFFITVYLLSGFALMFCMQKPVKLLQENEPEEFKKAVGDVFSIVTWKAIPFAYYLASGNYKKSIKSTHIVEQFTTSMWIARLQLFCLVAFCLFLFNS